MLEDNTTIDNSSDDRRLRGLLRVLIVEDSPDDLELLLRELRRGGFEPIYTCVDTFEGMEKALDGEKWDIIISDFDMPRFSGLAALALVKEKKLDLPFIVVSGVIDEEKIVDAMRANASDYIMKGNLSRLNAAVERELREARKRREHRRTAEDLKKLSMAVEQSPSTVVITDLEGKLEYVNPKFTELTGYSYHEVIGQNPSILNSGLQSKELYKELWDTILAGNTWQGEFHNRKKNGDLYWEMATISPMINENGETTHFIGVKEDITACKLAEQELRESELRFRTLFEELKDAVFVRSSEGRFLDINPAGVELFGYASRQEMMGLEFDADIYVHHEDILAFESEIEREGFVRDFETVMKRKDGSEIITSVTASSVRDSDGTITGYRSIVRDMTGFKELELQFIEAQKMEAVGVLAGGVAHDFNNILTAITLYAGSALDKLGEGSPASSDIKEVLESAYRAGELTKQLLIFGRNHTVELKPLSVNHVVEGIVKLIGRLIGEDISVELDIADDTHTIKADKCNIEQVLMNLSVNARDAMPEGGTIALSTKNVTFDDESCKTMPEADPGNYICLSVEDTGVGMNKETASRIFEPFYTTKAMGKGTGLGLAVVHGIVKKHRGWVMVDSAPGRGTIFNIYMPASVEECVQVKANDMFLGGDLCGREEKILLVEDQDDVRSPACRVLTECGYAVQEAASADEALAIFEREGGDFHLLFSDVILTGKSGLYLADELTARNPNMRVLLTSGHIDDKSQWPVIMDRGLDFISKPYSLNDLLSAVKGSLSEKIQKSSYS